MFIPIVEKRRQVNKAEGAAPAIGPTDARVPDFEGEYPTPFQPLRVGYRGKRKVKKEVKATAATASDAQLEAGNYKKQHIRFAGMEISIENKKGSTREGTSDGKSWSVKMHYDYGYIRRTEGVDGDHVDVYVGPNEDTEYVYVVHQAKPETGQYDEDKCMLGFDSGEDAKAAYLKQYDSPKFFGGMTAVPVSLFKEKVFDDKGEPVVSDAAKKVAEKRLKSLVLMHLPSHHDQSDHGRSRYRSKAIDESFDGKLAYSGLTEDEDGDKTSVTIYEVTKIRDPEKFVGEERTLIYDPATNKLYHAIDTEHLSIIKPLGLEFDKVVRFWTNPRSKAPRFSDWQSGVPVSPKGGEYEFNQDKALKNIDRASNKLVALGMPDKSAVDIYFWKTGKTITSTLKSLVEKHLPTRHDQKEHGHKSQERPFKKPAIRAVKDKAQLSGVIGKKVYTDDELTVVEVSQLPSDVSKIGGSR